jgi:hypothetical protein
MKIDHKFHSLEDSLQLIIKNYYASDEMKENATQIYSVVESERRALRDTAIYLLKISLEPGCCSFATLLFRRFRYRKQIKSARSNFKMLERSIDLITEACRELFLDFDEQ